MRGFFDHEKETAKIADEVKNAAYEIIEKKGATYYGIGMAVTRICTAIARDEKSVLSVSTLLSGHYGIEDICLSMPSLVGADGVECVVPLELSEEEQVALYKSSVELHKVIDAAL
jgi:L-lactate dehydrogenase